MTNAFKVYRRYLGKFIDYIFEEELAIFTEIDKAQEFLLQEQEDKSSMDLHLDSGIIQFELGKIYTNISQIEPIQTIIFNKL
jgi:hypothetical protein